MFYLTTHLTHFIYGDMASERLDVCRQIYYPKPCNPVLNSDPDTKPCYNLKLARFLNIPTSGLGF